MNRTEELIKLRNEIKKIQYKVDNEPAIIRLRDGGSEAKLAILKQQERELLETMNFEQIHAAELAAAESLKRTEDEEAAKTKKTLILAGSIAGIVILISIVAVIIIKKRKKQ